MEKKPKVLMVDDDPAFVNAVKMVLENEDFDVTVAYDGEEGWEKLRQETPDVMVLDVMMPKKDGFELCEEIKNTPEYEDVPILLLTAVGENIPTTRYSMRDGMDTQADDYIPKPVEPQELLRRVKSLIKA